MKFRTPDSGAHVYGLNKALELSMLSECSNKHGALISKNGKTISVGINYDVNCNSICTNPKTEASVHAEVAALKAAWKTDLNGASIYVARRNTKGEPLLSKPCLNCQEALKKRGISKVYYTGWETREEFDVQ